MPSLATGGTRRLPDRPAGCNPIGVINMTRVAKSPWKGNGPGATGSPTRKIPSLRLARAMPWLAWLQGGWLDSIRITFFKASAHDFAASTADYAAAPLLCRVHHCAGTG